MDVDVRISLVSREGGWRRGAVQEIRPVGQPWTERERASDKWRIVRVLDMPDALRVRLLAPQVPVDPMAESDPRRELLEMRAVVVDLDALPDGDVSTDALDAALVDAPYAIPSSQSSEGLRAAGWQGV